MPGFWDRLFGRRRDDAVRREAEEEQMSPEERRFIDESPEGRASDEFIEEHLGGVDPSRLIDDDRPPRDY